MDSLQNADIGNGVVRRYDYADASVVVADLGLPAQTSIDVVDGTAILVAPDDHADRQVELDLPEGRVAKALINNGVVTVEVER